MGVGTKHKLSTTAKTVTLQSGVELVAAVSNRGEDSGFGVRYFRPQVRMIPGLLAIVRSYLQMVPSFRNTGAAYRMSIQKVEASGETLPSLDAVKVWAAGGVIVEEYPWLVLPWAVIALLYDRGVFPKDALTKRWPLELNPVLSGAIDDLLAEIGGKPLPAMNSMLEDGLPMGVCEPLADRLAGKIAENREKVAQKPEIVAGNGKKSDKDAILPPPPPWPPEPEPVDPLAQLSDEDLERQLAEHDPE